MQLELVSKTVINGMLELFLRYAISTFKYCMHPMFL